MSIEAAEQAYLEGEYELAIKNYEDISGFESNPFILGNIANAYFENSNYGKSILYFYRAKKIIPRSKELNKNLKIVLDEIKLQQTPMLAYSWLNLWESLVLFFIFNLFFLLRNKLFKRNSKKLVLILLFVISTLNLSWLYWEQKIQKHAVITAISTKAYSGDNEAYAEITELLDGQLILVLREEKDWSKIKVGQNIAWVRNDAIQKI
jgi:tetratricopeptide (TPR) repeat protein